MGMYSFIRSFEFIRPLAYIFVEVGKASCVFCDDRNGRIWVNCITSRTEKNCKKNTKNCKKKKYDLENFAPDKEFLLRSFCRDGHNSRSQTAECWNVGWKNTNHASLGWNVHLENFNIVGEVDLKFGCKKLG